MDVILQNLDIILTAGVVLITAVILARRGQIALLRELILSLISSENEVSQSVTEAVQSRVRGAMPLMSRLLVSDKTVAKLVKRELGSNTNSNE